MHHKMESYGGENSFSAKINCTHRARSVLEAVDFESLDYLLLLPHDDKRFNGLVRPAFDLKIGSRRGAVVEGGQALEVIALYSLYAFTDKLIIGSFDLPYGRKLRNLLESGVATEYELISDVILGAMK